MSRRPRDTTVSSRKSPDVLGVNAGPTDGVLSSGTLYNIGVRRSRALPRRLRSGEVKLAYDFSEKYSSTAAMCIETVDARRAHALVASV